MRPRPRLWLVVEEGRLAGRRFAVDGPWQVVGRRRPCAILLEDRSVSRRHLRIRAVSGAVAEIEDLGSVNGTRVGGRWVRRARRVPVRTKMQIGRVTVRLERRWATRPIYGATLLVVMLALWLMRPAVVNWAREARVERPSDPGGARS